MQYQACYQFYLVYNIKRLDFDTLNIFNSNNNGFYIWDYLCMVRGK